MQTLEEHLETFVSAGGRADVARTVSVLAAAGAALSRAIAIGPLQGDMGKVVGTGEESGGDQQKFLDVEADRLFREAMAAAPVAVIGSEERESVDVIDAAAPLAVAVDPLDGSSNIDTNVSIGTIFAIFPVPPTGTGRIESALMQPGRDQLAAGFFIYGPQTALVVTLKAGTHIFTLDPRDGTFRMTAESVRIPENRNEYAINASNYRHWPRAVRDYIDDLISGATGPRGKDFNMRWVASMVAEAYRIMARGGIYLYPRDGRKGYENGRLRLVYEANPIALIFEQAGGGATDGVNRILDILPTALHQRTPLIFGSADKVHRVTRYHVDAPIREQSPPLFNERGLFRP
ncbi:MAG: class 1 fructose-bisphosphatase [Hyphomicrobiaceae bacterium]|nr:class 1 fructose-bisphosphatase [Hyphomicrobiaceae bacterium]